MNKMKQLLEKAQELPQLPGCYLMRDKNSQVIYVGKAKKLKNRVISYFNDSAKSTKTQFMVGHVQDFDFIVTLSDAESFILENNLIKEHSPKYNIRLRDDKSYPYVQVNWNEPFPRLEYVRRPKKAKDKELYGPFPTGSNISLILRVLTKSFGIRDCSLTEFRSRKTPCLLFQMKQCSAPCVGLIAEQDYEKDLEMALSFFKGPLKAKKTLQTIVNKMQKYSDQEEYEMAGILRDHIKLLEDFLSQSYDQSVEFLQDDKDIDVWSFYNGKEEIDFSLYMVRSGLLLGHKNFTFIKGEFIDEIQDEIFKKIVQYYSECEVLNPEKIIIDTDEDLNDLEKVLNTFSKTKISGKSKKYLPLIEMTRKHAEESQRIRIANEESVFIGLNKLKELLSLKERPRILECYDVAIWQGKSPTASQVVFEEGKAIKESYRYYHLEERPEGNNDFAMMREVMLRRLDNGKLPDVLVIDGGIQQVNVVAKVLEELDLNIPVVGIAKSRDLTSGDLKTQEVSRTDERLIIPGRSNPYILSKCPSLFKILVSMRDEAHRFSRKLHHKAETKRVLSTWIDEVRGLSGATKKDILNKLTQTKEELAEFTVTELKNYFDISDKDAKNIWKYLQNLNS